jgi:hypothetical protein
MIKSRDEMFRHITNWENSNLSQLDFCKKNGIALGTFGYWRKRYLQKEKTETKVKVFKPIKLVAKTENNYKITYPNGVCISIPSGVDKNELSKLIRCLD